MIDVFKYSNYRRYLRDYYHWRKDKQPSFSYRLLAQKAGINSSSFFKYVMEGKRNLSRGTLEKVCAALPLSGVEREYFKHLVFFNQADSVKEKNQTFSRLTELRNRHDIKIVEPRDYDFYKEWYHPVVRELVVLPGLARPEVLAKCLEPEISVSQAKASIVLLEKLGFIQKQEDGNYRQREPVLSSGEEIRAAAVIGYQIKMFELSLKAMESAKPGTYLASSTVLGLSHDNIKKAKDIIRKCRAQLLDLAGHEKHVQAVHQLNIHLFSVGKMPND